MLLKVSKLKEILSTVLPVLVLLVLTDTYLYAQCTDLEPPVCEPKSVTVHIDPGSGLAPVLLAQEIDGSSSDDCGIVQWQINGSDFWQYDCSHVGPNNASLIVWDGVGNSSECLTSIFVVDDTAPSCYTQDITAYLDNNGQVTISPDDVENADICDDNPFHSTLVVSNPLTCYADSDAVISVDVLNGGESPYKRVSWYNQETGTMIQNCEYPNLTPDCYELSNVPAGRYSIEIEGANGCIHTHYKTIVQPDALRISALVQNDNGNILDGGVNLSVSGGDIPYSFLWENGETQSYINQLPAGDVSVTITDNNGCKAFRTYTIGDQGSFQNVNDPGQFNNYGVDNDYYENDSRRGFFDNCGIKAVNLSKTQFFCFEIDRHIVDVYVTDNNDIESSCFASVELRDTLPPNCAQNVDLIINLEPGQCDSMVRFSLPFVFDNCDAVPSVNTIPGEPESGDRFEAGVHEVRYHVEDIYGNSQICSFDIIVEDFNPGALVCKNINVSLDEKCSSVITPEMVLANPDFGCPDNYEIEVWDPHGNSLGYVLNDTHHGDELNYMICHTISGLCCWGAIIVEDKYPPVLECQEVIVSACNGLDDIEEPKATENCTTYELNLVDEKIDAMPCNPQYIKVIERTYVAVDETGAESLPCVQKIYLERPNIRDNIIFPANTTVYCDDTYALTAEGYPAPSETGVPRNIKGDPFYPDIPDQYCNTYVTFTDEEISVTSCKVKIMRNWEIREWWCTNELTFGGVQFIEIVDHTGPTFDIPDDVVGSTTANCEGRVYLPPIDPDDICGSISGYSIQFPGGLINTNGGNVMMPIGENTVTYVVYDDCYNSSYGTMTVTIADYSEPVASCEQNTVVSIPREGRVDVLAEVFDDGSWDDCGIHSFEAIRMDTFCNPADTIWGPSIEFCCDDVGLDLRVALLVTDYEGNTNACMVNVHVQDKIVPEIYCPEDTIIECQMPYDINNLDLIFGSPTTQGNCSNVPITEELETNLNQCGLGTIKRIFSIEDENGAIVSSCFQVITIVNNSPFNPLSIDWPDNFSTEDICDLDGLLPENLDAQFAAPIYFDDQCDLLGHNYEDELFDFTVGAEACLKVIRTWTVINWCQKDLAGNVASWTGTQELKLNNTIDPEIDGSCEDFVQCTYNVDCLPAIVELIQSGTDDCTPDSLLKWKYDIDLFSNGDIDTTGYSSIATDTFPIGVHHIYWSAIDRCGNEDRCNYSFELRSCTAPTPVCIQGLSIDLVPMDTLNNDGIPDAEMATIWAEDFNGSSFHTCGNPFTFSFSQDTTDKSIVYDCEDLGLNVITMWVTDVLTGAQDYCETFIDVQDNNTIDICPPQDTTGGNRISGHIYTEDSEMIEDVRVNLIGPESSSEMTDVEGSYAFEDAEYGRQYVVDPSKRDDPLNGVSTLDLVLIQRHILGSNMIDSPYKLIAADVNKDESISTIDLIELRKLILGVYDDFPQNESWRFIDADYEFADPKNPWSDSFAEEYNIALLSQNMNIDFLGLKVGDVNGTAVAGILSESSDSRNNSVKIFVYENIELIKGQKYSVYFKANQDISLSGAQFNIHTNSIEVLNINSPVFDFEKSNWNKLNEENIIVSMHGNEAIEMEKGKTLFNMIFTAERNSSLEEEISISSEFLNSEVYDESLQSYKMEISPRGKERNLVLYQNVPNPWKENTRIAFDLNQDAELTFRFYNTIGAKLFEKKSHFTQGYHTIDFSSEDLGTSGLIIYEVIVGNEKYNKKMIMLN